MQSFYYITGAMVLVLGGLGIYSSQAGNKVLTEPDGMVVVEEVIYQVAPKQPKAINNMPLNNMENSVSKGGFMPLAQDSGVEVAPLPEEQNIKPDLEQAPVDDVNVQEEVIETVN